MFKIVNEMEHHNEQQINFFNNTRACMCKIKKTTKLDSQYINTMYS